MGITDVVGAIASVCSFLLFLPQAVSTWKNRKDKQALKGISKGTQWLIICNATSWFILGFLEQNIYIALPGVVNLPLAVFTLVLIHRSYRQTKLIHQEVL